MRLTVTLDGARETLTVRVEHALAYPPEAVARRVADVVAQTAASVAVTDQAEPHPGKPGASTTIDPAAVEVPNVPAPRGVSDPTSGEDARIRALRRWALRLLDRGLTLDEVAARVPIPAELITRWDDDAAVDAETDQLADPAAWSPPGVAS